MSSNGLGINYVYVDKVFAGAITLPILAVLTVALRFFIRFKRAYVGPDDWTILFALFPVIGIGICILYGISQHAVGYPSPPYPDEMDPPILEQLFETTPQQTLVFTLDWIIWLFVILANGLTKLSVLLFYRRVFVTHKNSLFDIADKSMIVLISLWIIAFESLQIFGCGRHFSYPFATLAQLEACNTNAHLDALIITDFVTDTVVLFLPVPLIWQLRMNVKKKLIVTAVLLLGGFLALSAAITRIYVQEKVSKGGYDVQTDINLALTIVIHWSMAESAIALLAACVPSLLSFVNVQLIRDVLHRLGQMFTSDRKSSISLQVLTKGEQRLDPLPNSV